MSRKGRIRLVVGLLVAAVAVAAIVLWPSKGNSADKAGQQPTATPTHVVKSADQQYFDSLSQAIKAGDLQKQATYVALGPDGKFRANFIQRGVPMLPKGSTVTFLANTLVTDSPNTGGVKAVVVKNGVKSTVSVLLLKEKDNAGHMVWHITDVEKASS